jgi:peptide/nickel transport system ATP-binding protein
MVMYAGKIVESATTRNLFSQMRHPYSEALLDSIPKMDADASVPLYSIPGVPPDLSGEFIGCRFEPRCRNATERCRTEEPPLLDEGNHAVACFNPVGSATAPRHELRVVDATVAKALALQRVNELASRKVIVEVDQLVKEFPVTAGAVLQRKIGSVKAVSNVSFAVREGETFGLVGESGCGKTTIGRLVVALEKPTSGAIRFDGTDVTKLGHGALRRSRRDFQIMFQDPYASLDPRMRVGTILREPLKVQKIGSRTEQWERVGGLLREVGLSKKAIDLYPHEFSGGQRQRIGFARALTLNPRLIVADEPVSALDVSIQSQILNMMKALQRTHRLTYIVISHDLAVLRFLSDRIGVMYLGKLVEIGAAKEIYETPAHHYTRGLIDTIPVPDPVLAADRRGHHISGELPSALTPPSGCRFRTRCPAAQEICAEEEPPLQSFGGDHMAACHFPLQSPVAMASMAATGSSAAQNA